VSNVWSRVKGIAEYAAIFSDLNSVQEFRRLYNAPRSRTQSSAVAKFRLRALKGNYAYCRTAGSDINVFSDTFRKNYHLPPRELKAVRKILDLGSNIGLTMAHFAALFPEAHVLGIELDAGNVEVCRRNIAPYSDRCRIVRGAVWNEPGEISYSGEEEWGFRVTSDRVPERVVKAYTMEALIQELGAPVDYVKMDVEGTERDLLKEPRFWVGDVPCMKIEVHEPYTMAECVSDLEKCRFRTAVDDRHPACLVAYNTDIKSST
jgi:FkbM family methyltransferase